MTQATTTVQSKFTSSVPSVVRQVEWNVENFKRIARDKESLETLRLLFDVQNTLGMPPKWSMYFQLAEDGDSIGVFLKMIVYNSSQVDKVPVKYEFQANSGVGGIVKHCYGPSEEDFKLTGWGSTLISRASLMAPASDYLPNGTLTVKLTMEMFAAKPVNIEVIDKKKTEKLQLQGASQSAALNDISKLLNSGLNSDLVIQTKYQKHLQQRSKIFHVHRNVLSARSPVFKAMFATNMKENSNGCVEIEDIGSKTMGLLLKYCYSGVLGSCWTKVAEEMIYAADKYDLPLLKDICDLGLIDAVTPETAMDFLVIAKRHSLPTATADISLLIKDKLGLFLESLLKERSKPEGEDDHEVSKNIPADPSPKP